MLQAPFDLACSWMVVESASYHPRLFNLCIAVLYICKILLSRTLLIQQIENKTIITIVGDKNVTTNMLLHGHTCNKSGIFVDILKKSSTHDDLLTSYYHLPI